jgi:hypothetical protein
MHHTHWETLRCLLHRSRTVPMTMILRSLSRSDSAVSVAPLTNCSRDNDSRIPLSYHDSGGFLVFFISGTSLMSAFVLHMPQGLFLRGAAVH